MVVYSLLMNYSYGTFYCCWAESLLLVQILMVYYESYYESPPKIMSCSEKLGLMGQTGAFFVVSLTGLILYKFQIWKFT